MNFEGLLAGGLVVAYFWVMSKLSDRRPRDANQLGKLMVDIMSGEVEDKISPKKKAPKQQGRAGGLKGGKSRAQTLTAEERQAIAQRAARKRWGSGKP